MKNNKKQQIVYIVAVETKTDRFSQMFQFKNRNSAVEFQKIMGKNGYQTGMTQMLPKHSHETKTEN